MSKKKILIVLSIIIALPLIFLGGRSFVLDHIRAKLEDQIYKLRDAGFIVNYDSITIDWKENTVEVFSLSVKHDLDTSLCHKSDFIYAKHITAGGFRVIPLLLKRHLSFEFIELDSPSLSMNQSFFKKDTVKREKKEFTIIVDKLKLPTLHFEYYNAKTCEIGSSYEANAAIQDLRLAFLKDSPVFIDMSSFSADSIRIEIPDEFYTLAVNEITYKPNLGILDVDTIKITPYHSKQAFGRKKGYEIDRFEGLVPYLNVAGLSLNREDSVSIKAKTITAQLFLKVFRDKRLPFKQKYKNLPLDALHAMSIGINVETVRLVKSFVMYEEFAEDADSSGSVYFDDMYATISQVNNTDPYRKGKTELSAQASFMGEGKIKVNAIFPWDSKLQHRVKGTIENMEMKNLNPMIEPAIQVRAESGHLNRLSFDFSCGQNKSHGQIELNYNDLKLTAFKKEEKETNNAKSQNGSHDEGDDKAKKASFKSFIMNTFIIRKNMDKGVPFEKRTGTVDFTRDKNKSVFNYWFKSVLSGVKSAYHIDKIEDSKLVKLLKKKKKNKDKG